MFFGPKTTMNVMSANYISSSDPKPIAFKGNWLKDQMNGDGFLNFSDGLCIFAQFKDNLLKDTVL